MAPGQMTCTSTSYIKILTEKRALIIKQTLRTIAAVEAAVLVAKQLKDGGSLRCTAVNWWHRPGRKLTCQCRSFRVDQSNGRHEHRTTAPTEPLY